MRCVLGCTLLGGGGLLGVQVVLVEIVVGHDLLDVGFEDAALFSLLRRGGDTWFSGSFRPNENPR
ncbi:hypothetical protein [Halorussus caseinilyticus]|uniref:Secreted protein n=1 Tax=Halorussus caseinilyticus TaxID=3034025 RepID=A0ABD5WLB1_9EURY